MKVLATCIKEYYCEDSLDEFNDGLIGEEDIKLYRVGEKHYVWEPGYDKEYWKV